MLFDIAPKTKREDLYDFEHELGELHRSIEHSRLIAILAPRRYGKSSLLKVFLGETRHLHIFLDLRKIVIDYGRASIRAFYECLSDELTGFICKYENIGDKLVKALKHVKGVSISGFSVSLSWSRKSRANIATLFEKVNEIAEKHNVKVILALDEVQELRNIINVPMLLAYIYDNLRNIVTIITGSEVGLVYDVLKLEDPESPLYGRVVKEIRLRKLSYTEAYEFLRMGFKQLNVEFSEELLDKIISEVDGIIGWLTYYGWFITQHRAIDIEEIKRKAATQAAVEIKRFLERSRSRERYYNILKAISSGIKRWSDIKRFLEAKEGMEIDDSTFNKLLKTLIKFSFVRKADENYAFNDPLLEYAVKYLL